jgi:hypothetical protein
VCDCLFAASHLVDLMVVARIEYPYTRRYIMLLASGRARWTDRWTRVPLHEEMDQTCIHYARVCKPHGHQGRSRASFAVYSGHRSACCGCRAACRCIHPKCFPVDNLMLRGPRVLGSSTLGPLNIHSLEVFLGCASPCLMDLFTPRI